MKPIRTRIFATDPYEGFDPLWAEPDLQGWGHDHPIFARCIEEVKPRVILEVGCWKGAAAIHMAGKARDLGLDPEIVSIDTWLGPPNVYLHGVNKLQPYRLASLRAANGYPMLYYTFMRNVVDAGLQAVITPLPQTPENAAKTLRHCNVAADLIFVDGTTDTAQLGTILRDYWSLLRPGGYLVGKDFENPDVKAAVQKFATKAKVAQEVITGRWRFIKPQPGAVAALPAAATLVKVAGLKPATAGTKPAAAAKKPAAGKKPAIGKKPAASKPR